MTVLLWYIFPMTEIIGDRIDRPINSIDEVRTLIMDGARTKVLSLDWPHFNVSREKARALLDFASPIILRNADGLDLPVGLLDEKRPEEKFILKMIGHQHKREVAPKSGFWLTMFACPISPDDATFASDVLCAKGIEVISAANQLDAGQVAEHFLQQDLSGGLQQMVTRVTEEEAKRRQLSGTDF